MAPAAPLKTAWKRLPAEGIWITNTHSMTPEFVGAPKNPANEEVPPVRPASPLPNMAEYSWRKFLTARKDAPEEPESDLLEWTLEKRSIEAGQPENTRFHPDTHETENRSPAEANGDDHSGEHLATNVFEKRYELEDCPFRDDGSPALPDWLVQPSPTGTGLTSSPSPTATSSSPSEEVPSPSTTVVMSSRTASLDVSSTQTAEPLLAARGNGDGEELDLSDQIAEGCKLGDLWANTCPMEYWREVDAPLRGGALALVVIGAFVASVFIGFIIAGLTKCIRNKIRQKKQKKQAQKKPVGQKLEGDWDAGVGPKETVERLKSAGWRGG